MANLQGLAVVHSSVTFDVARIRADFPILAQRSGGRPLVYLDNAATSQKPQQVIDAVRQYYEAENANIHRGVHRLSAAATLAYEHARANVQRFINASDPHEVVFVRGTTEAINLVAQSYLRPKLAPGDRIVLSQMEHHSNIVPWQIVAEQTGAKIVVLPMTDAGELELDKLPALLGDGAKFLSVVHISNSLGTINPIAEIVAIAHERDVPVLVDGAQAAPHMPVDVRALGCDFYALSGHKMLGPTGIGVLYGRGGLLEEMPPYHGGGEMIRNVTFERTTYAPPPARFEAGTPNIAGAMGLGVAVEYLHGLPWDGLQAHEEDLRKYATEQLVTVPGVRIVGTAAKKAAVVSFVMEGVHAHDIGTILDQRDVAIRAGHHCTQPVMDRLGLPATARASFAFYNTREEVDILIEGVREVREIFSP